MSEVKEIIVYSNGDSRSLKTWSNVPYLFTQTLENKGIKIDRVDYSEVFRYKKSIAQDLLIFVSKIYRHVVALVIKEKTIWKYNYTDFCTKKVERIIQESSNKYKNADLQLMFGFSYSKKTSIPFVMLSDWTIEYRLKNKYNRLPIEIEKRIIEKQYKTLDKADAIISILPESYKEMKKYYPTKTFYLGHFINTVEPYHDCSKTKSRSNHIVFVGRKSEYKQGLETLIRKISRYNKEHPKKIVLDIIGMCKEDISEKEYDVNHCNFYGYLDKSNENECKQYYSLLRQAKAFVNPTKKWIGISSIYESLYHGTPVITCYNKEVVSMIDNKDIVMLINNDNQLYESIYKIMNMDSKRYESISKECHNYVKDYTWDNYIDRFINVCGEVIKNKNQK